MPSTFYRITKTSPPTATDFMSNLQKCLPPRGPELRDPGEWAGISMYETIEQAAATTERYRYAIGQFVTRVDVPDGAPAVVRAFVKQTGGPGHYTLWACAERFLQLVVDTTPARK
jgi:hypothetical protein